MRRIEAIIRPSKLEDVKRVLSHAWIAGLTVVEVAGHGQGEGRVEVHRGAERAVEAAPRLKVEIVIPAPLVPRVLHDLVPLVRTGRAGDGKIFVAAVDGAVRIRTGDRGEDAL